MEEEMLTIERNDTWELVDAPEDKNVIGLKWVFRTKSNADGRIQNHKARLVAKGYLQQQGVDFDETFSPVARFETMRIMLLLAAQLKLPLYQLDVKFAFLNAKRILRYVAGISDFGVWYSKTSSFKLIGFTDNDWAGIVDNRKSTSESIFFLGSGSITWSSKKQETVALSSSKAENAAASSPTRQALWLRNYLLILVIFKQKLLDFFVTIVEGKIYLKFCGTNEQAADIFTKALPQAKHDFFSYQTRPKPFVTPSRSDKFSTRYTVVVMYTYARPVARGDKQIKGKDLKHTFTHVANFTTVRFFIALTAAHDWNLQKLDVNNAVLSGFIDEDIYMTHPPGYTKAAPGLVCNLKRSIYGLRHASGQ
ncbi:hypothetical protein AgCh_026521 [Apium graveolens]